MSLLSYEHNCLIYNAIIKNNSKVDDNDVFLLQDLRSSTDSETIIDYYNRSAQLIPKINKIYATDPNIWDQYYKQYVKSIVDLIKQNKRKESLDKISEMLDSLESTV